MTMFDDVSEKGINSYVSPCDLFALNGYIVFFIWFVLQLIMDVLAERF